MHASVIDSQCHASLRFQLSAWLYFVNEVLLILYGSSILKFIRSMTETTPEEIKPKTINPFRAICERVLDDWLFKVYPAVFLVHDPIPLALGTSKELIGQ